MKKIFALTICLALLAGPILGHDDGHKTPARLPPAGPHGGKYTKLVRHFARCAPGDLSRRLRARRQAGVGPDSVRARTVAVRRAGKGGSSRGNPASRPTSRARN